MTLDTYVSLISACHNARWKYFEAFVQAHKAKYTEGTEHWAMRLDELFDAQKELTEIRLK